MTRQAWIRLGFVNLFCYTRIFAVSANMEKFYARNAATKASTGGTPPFKSLSGVGFQSAIECPIACLEDPVPCLGFAFDDTLLTCDLYNTCKISENVAVYMQEPVYCPEQLGFQKLLFGRCQLCLRLVNNPRSFFEAVDECRGVGAEMFHFKGYVEKINALPLLLSTFGIESVAVWIGASDTAREGDFLWMHDNSSVAKTEDMPWFGGEPNGDRMKNCMEMKADFHPSVSVNDIPCSRMLIYVCEI